MMSKKTPGALLRLARLTSGHQFNPAGKTKAVQRSFSAGTIDYDGSMSRDFNSGRALSSDSLAVWRAALEPRLGRAANVLDLGSGTGRFSTLIAEWVGALVIGVEPARGMRKVAASSGSIRMSSTLPMRRAASA